MVWLNFGNTYLIISLLKIEGELVCGRGKQKSNMGYKYLITLVFTFLFTNTSNWKY